VGNSYESGELQRLSEQLAALTRRVYRLEELLTKFADPSAVAAPSVQESGSTVGPSPQPHEQPTHVVRESRIPPVEPVIAPQYQPPPSLVQNTAPAPSAPVRGTSKGSLESRIGGQWLNRIGIVAVLVGLSYFLKFAFDNNWIGPATQVIIGMFAGLAVLFWSERFRRKGYPGFAYSLKAVAFGALYLSLWAASQYYHLLPGTVTFFGMMMVTLTAIALSLRQSAELLAAFALVGGFLTPVLVSTGENHEVALFCYIALLDLGTVWMVALKRWPRVLFGSFVGTVLLAAAWASTYYSEPQLGTTIVFASFFFLLYALAAFAEKSTSPFSNLMTILALLSAGIYFLAGHLMLQQHYLNEFAWLTAAVAAFYFGFAWLLKKRAGDAAPLYSAVALALAVGFLTAAIPLGFETHWIVLGWLVEAGALFWAAHRSPSVLLRSLGVVALGLGTLRLVLVDSEGYQPLLFNARFGLYLIAIAALALLAHYALVEGGEANRQWAAGAILALNVLALTALNFEVANYFRLTLGVRRSTVEWRALVTARAFTYSAVWMVYGGALMLVGFWKRSAFLRWQAIVLLAITTAKVFLYDISALERGFRIVAFIVLGGILLGVSFFYQRNRAKMTQ
jgi:uncharacterized membrane protein